MIHSQRLRQCAQKFGGISKFANETGVSRAQFNRYLAGTPVPSDTLRRMANTANVSVGWLMGEAAAGQLGLRDYLNLTRETAERLQLQLQRTTLPRAFNSIELARAIELMVFSQTYVYNQSGEYFEYTENDIYHGLHYLNHLCQYDNLEVYVEGCKIYAGL
ncbi:MAG: helix-turn-helix transcriptional regulator, partial [Alphaproteobacteria bacterium]|nr:helix-turn-helix transcriptional regulator [Alphaproteobacteria bacterium]